MIGQNFCEKRWINIAAGQRRSHSPIFRTNFSTEDSGERDSPARLNHKF